MLRAIIVDGYFLGDVAREGFRHLQVPEGRQYPSYRIVVIPYMQEGGFVQHMVVYDPEGTLECMREEDMSSDAYQFVCEDEYHEVFEEICEGYEETGHPVELDWSICGVGVRVVYQIWGLDKFGLDKYQA